MKIVITFDTDKIVELAKKVAESKPVKTVCNVVSNVVNVVCEDTKKAAGVAKEKTKEYAGAAKDKTKEYAGVVKDKTKEYAGVVKEKGSAYVQNVAAHVKQFGRKESGEPAENLAEDACPLNFTETQETPESTESTNE